MMKPAIFIVDDDEVMRQTLSDVFKKRDYEVLTADTGKEAVAMIHKQTIDLVLLDMIMDPGIDGLDAYLGIREIHPGQKAIITSGYSETDRVKDAQRLGAGEYVKKPYTLEKIGAAVRRELGK